MVEQREQPAPRLTRLDVHGFKSFATRTTFRFEPGITAIVGPNGSGKSNISDAVRWVLGETSYSALRSKKTEDVIFAGGKGRSPSGMAEVTVTFNNEERWLPSEFTEVTVTRRAHRSGESQYLINGRKVRLKDVAQLVASLGHSYTVVGQGLVDQALSQRQIAPRIEAGLVGGALGERVLDDGELRAVLQQLGAEVVDLRHRQAAVVGHDQRLGRLEPFGQLRHDPLFVLFLHLTSSNAKAAHGRPFCSCRR